MGAILPLAIIATVAVLASGYVSTGLKLKNLSGRLSGIRYKKQAGFFNNLLQQKLLIDFDIDNPNNGSVNFEQLKLDVKYGTRKLANINVVKLLKLPANDTTRLKDIEVSVSTVALGTELLDFLMGNNEGKKKTFSYSGSIKADGLVYPVSGSYQM